MHALKCTELVLYRSLLETKEETFEACLNNGIMDSFFKQPVTNLAPRRCNSPCFKIDKASIQTVRVLKNHKLILWVQSQEEGRDDEDR